MSSATFVNARNRRLSNANKSTASNKMTMNGWLKASRTLHKMKAKQLKHEVICCERLIVKSQSWACHKPLKRRSRVPWWYQPVNTLARHASSRDDHVYIRAPFFYHRLIGHGFREHATIHVWKGSQTASSSSIQTTCLLLNWESNGMYKRLTSYIHLQRRCHCGSLRACNIQTICLLLTQIACVKDWHLTVTSKVVFTLTSSLSSWFS